VVNVCPWRIIAHGLFWPGNQQHPFHVRLDFPREEAVSQLDHLGGLNGGPDGVGNEPHVLVQLWDFPVLQKKRIISRERVSPVGKGGKGLLDVVVPLLVDIPEEDARRLQLPQHRL